MEELLAKLNFLGLGGQGGGDTPPPPPKVLEDLTLVGVVKHIRKLQESGNKQKVVVMTGAGISTAAGIPDFRSPGTGLYDNLQKYNLPTPESIFDIRYFRCNPKPFYHLAKELYPALFKPTLSHYFVRLLAEEGLLLRNFTQNIDTLERRAGIADDYLVEAHGCFEHAHCITCHKDFHHDYVRERVFRGELVMCDEPGCASIPKEEGEPYFGLVKPDIVFFGEALPERFAQLAVEDTSQCELLIIMGTSLKVHPFASLTDRVPSNCPRLLINMEKVGVVDPIMKLLGMGGGGLDFSEETGYRDVFLEGKCDDGCLELAKMLGWEEKLKEMYQTEHKKLDQEIEVTRNLLGKLHVTESGSDFEGGSSSEVEGSSSGVTSEVQETSSDVKGSEVEGSSSDIKESGSEVKESNN